jgi:hypothetical protein
MHDYQWLNQRFVFILPSEKGWFFGRTSGINLYIMADKKIFIKYFRLR